MTGTARDRLWIAALALARTRASFATADVLAAADLPAERTPAATAVLGVMREYGFLERVAEGEWTAQAVPLTDAVPSGYDGTFTYLSAPGARWTFAPDAVREWVEARLEGRVLNLFAGDTRLRHDGEVVRNDVDESIAADVRVDARAIADRFPTGSFDTVVLDPPLSMHGSDVLERVRGAVADLLRADGLAITAGRNSVGMGSTRGFETVELCLVAHPGGGHDTILVVERSTGDPAGEAASAPGSR